MIKTLWAIFYSEFIVRLRHFRETLYPLCFFSIITLLFSLSLPQDPALQKIYLPSTLWVSAMLANMLAVQQVFWPDLEDGHSDLLQMSPVPLFFVLLVKALAVWVVSTLPLILFAPLIAFVFQLSLLSIALLVLSLLLGTPILILVGALASLLTLSHKQQSILLGILVLPITVPILLLGLSIINEQQSLADVLALLGFLSAVLIVTLLFVPLAMSTIFKLRE